jgi:peptidoglycan/LPS O-acetylase OafA/YrhL
MQLGIVSYCVYLIHGSVMSIIDRLLRLVLNLSDVEIWLAIFLAAAMTALLAQGSWQVFELRMIALGHRFAYERNKALQTATTGS